MDAQALLGSEFELNTPLPKTEQLRFISSLKGPVPNDYLEFMKLFNGGEGPVGNESYLALFGLEELLDYNDSQEHYSSSEYTVFASDGGNTIFAFDKSGEVLEFDLIGLGPDEAIRRTGSFIEFLATLP